MNRVCSTVSNLMLIHEIGMTYTVQMQGPFRMNWGNYISLASKSLSGSLNSATLKMKGTRHVRFIFSWILASGTF